MSKIYYRKTHDTKQEQQNLNNNCQQTIHETEKLRNDTLNTNQKS